MNKALAQRACCVIFSAIALLSWDVVSYFSRCNLSRTYRIHSLDNRSIEELAWTARIPFSVLLIKVKAVKVANDTSHGHRAITPRRSECKIEFIILDILISSYVSLHISISLHSTSVFIENAYNTDISSSQMMSNRFGDGRLFSYT